MHRVRPRRRLERGRTATRTCTTSRSTRRCSPALPGNPDLVDPNRWQPLALDFFIDQCGNPIPGGFPPFLSPGVGPGRRRSRSTPDDLTIYHARRLRLLGLPRSGAAAAARPPTATTTWTASSMVGVVWSRPPRPDRRRDDRHLARLDRQRPLPDPGDWRPTTTSRTAATGARATREPGDRPALHAADRARAATTRACSPSSGPTARTPRRRPGTGSRSPTTSPIIRSSRSASAGRGRSLDDLEWDVKVYLMLGGAMHDVAIAAWGIKGWYDYIRPISAIRYHGRARPVLRSARSRRYDPDGIALRPGFDRGRHGRRAARRASATSTSPRDVGKIAIRAWRGPDFIADPDDRRRRRRLDPRRGLVALSAADLRDAALRRLRLRAQHLQPRGRRGA